MLRALIDAGVNIFRINMSHAKHETVRELVPRVRLAAEQAGKVVGILLDTQGPAIRTGELPAKLALKKGDIFEFTVRGAAPTETMSVGVNYDFLVDDVHVGYTLIVDNGLLHMRVLSKTENAIRCEVLTPGEMGSRRHINLPGVHVKLPALTDKDLADVALAAEMRVDFVALSFCRFPQDVEQLRSVLLGHGSTARIVAKIEDRRGDGGARGSRHRVRDGGTADHPAQNREALYRARPPGHRGDSNAGEHDHQSRADPRGSHRRGKRGL
jgi:pyruvate kinase